MSIGISSPSPLNVSDGFFPKIFEMIEQGFSIRRTETEVKLKTFMYKYGNCLHIITNSNSMDYDREVFVQVPLREYHRFCIFIKNALRESFSVISSESQYVESAVKVLVIGEKILENGTVSECEIVEELALNGDANHLYLNAPGKSYHNMPIGSSAISFYPAEWYVENDRKGLPSLKLDSLDDDTSSEDVPPAPPSTPCEANM